MMSVDEVRSAKEGEEYEAASLMPTVSDKRIRLTVKKVEELPGAGAGARKVSFLASFMGITLGLWAATLVGDTVLWGFGER